VDLIVLLFVLGLLVLVWRVWPTSEPKLQPLPYLGINGETHAYAALEAWRKYQKSGEADDRNLMTFHYSRAQSHGYGAFIALIRSCPDGDEMMYYMEDLND